MNPRKHRTKVDLNGEWEFVTDPEGVGSDEGWMDPGSVWPDSARPVEVPHAWQERDAYREYTGTAWYRRTVTGTERDDGERALLRFGAVDYETTVWVNGDRIGTNRGGYLPFTFDVTESIREGDNTVVVEVADPEDASEIPHGKQGAPWYQRVSGIWQDVTLSFVPSTRVTDVRVTPDLGSDTAHVEFDVATSEGGVPADLTSSIRLSNDGEHVAKKDVNVTPDGTASASVSLDDPDYWTPETPVLYDITVTLFADGDRVDREADHFGMRSVEVEGGELLLNGEPYAIRGALDQGYYPKTHYRPFSDTLFESEIRTAKDLGFNLLRKHIKPAHPEFLDAADRLGILVWEEPANPTVHTERSKREVRDQLDGMIDRDYNRPSVIIWSLYNEEWGIGNPQGLDEETSLWDDEKKQTYLADLYERTRTSDPTRVVCDNSGWAHVATDLNDYHRYFVSPDRASAWGDDLDSMTAAPEENYGATVTDPSDAPLIVSEFGTWGMCDLPEIEAFYGGTPSWFDYDFFDSPIKRPEGVYDRYAETTLPDIFDEWKEFAAAWQAREFRSIKDVIEQMRVHEGVDGYVITELTDIEWEFNGVLDYRREEKSFHEDFAMINDDVLVRVEPDHHVFRAGERFAADISVCNDTARPIEGTVEWEVFDQSGSVPVTVDPHGVTDLSGAIEAVAPERETRADGTLSGTTTDLTVTVPGTAENAEPITVVPRTSLSDGVTVYADASPIADALDAVGFEVTTSIDRADVAFLVEPGKKARRFAESGGSVVVLPNRHGHMVDEEFFEYRELPETESWNLVASLFYGDDETVTVGNDPVLGWEYEGLYPYDVVADIADDDDVRIGYVEGWIANRSAGSLTRSVGTGDVTAFTFRVTGDDRVNPVGVAALTALATDRVTN